MHGHLKSFLSNRIIKQQCNIFPWSMNSHIIWKLLKILFNSEDTVAKTPESWTPRRKKWHPCTGVTCLEWIVLWTWHLLFWSVKIFKIVISEKGCVLESIKVTNALGALYLTAFSNLKKNSALLLSLYLSISLISLWD